MAKGGKIQTFAQQLMNKYVPFFDVEKDKMLGNTQLAFAAAYKRRDEKYMLTKKIKIWGVENQQVVFVSVSPEPVTVERVQQYIDDLENDFALYVPSHEEHMSTIITGILVTDQAVSEKIVKKVRKYRKVKFVKFGLHGWVEIYFALVDLKQKKLTIHPKGHSFVQVIDKLVKEEREGI